LTSHTSEPKSRMGAKKKGEILGKTNKQGKNNR